MAKPKQQRKLVPAYLFWAAALVFIITATRAHVGDMPRWEYRLFIDIYHWPWWLTPAMFTITLLGSTWMVIMLSAWLFIARKTYLALTVVTIGITSYAVTEAMKHIVNRPRPYVLLPHVFSREWFASGLGFPSGHTAVTTALGLVLFRYLPKDLRWLVPLWIVGVAISRIYLGVHAPLDVIGGFCVGLTLAYIFGQFEPWLKKQLGRSR